MKIDAKKNQIIIIVLLLLGILSFWWLKSRQDLRAKGFAPILNIGAADPDFRPIIFALRDPVVAKRRPTDVSDMAQLAQEIREIRTGIAALRGERAAEQNEQAYVGLAAMTYYFQDQLRVLGSGTPEWTKTKQNLLDISRQLENHASLVAQLAKPAQVRDRASYFYYASRYATWHLGQAGGNLADVLKAFKALGESKELSQDLRRRAQVIVAFHGLQNKDKAARAAAAAKLQNLSRNMEPVVRVGVSLALAKSAKRISPNQADGYKKHLMLAAQRSGGLSSVEKSQVIRQLVSVWRQHDRQALVARQGKNGAAKVPFTLVPFKDTVEFLAIAERSALVDWKANEPAQAIRKVEKIAGSVSKNPAYWAFKADIDGRVLDMRRAIYLQKAGPNDGAVSYEKALILRENQYQELGVLGPSPESQSLAQGMRLKWTGYRRELAFKELERSQSTGARSRAIGIAERFLSDHPKDSEQTPMRETLAKVYVDNKNYESAVGIYSNLAQSASGVAEKKRYLLLSIGAQSLLANWPKAAPWDNAPAVNDNLVSHRDRLRTIYGDLARLSPQDWFVAAHIGHLNISLGQADKAFQDWRAMIASSPRDNHASQAAGYMFAVYERAGSWPQLESLARLCLKQRVMGTFQSKQIDPHQKLGLALLESGKGFLGQKNYRLAVGKLKEFSAMRPLPASHDEGFYHLSLAQWGDRQFRAGVQTALDFAESYPQSRYYRPALLNGGDWSGMLAFEESVLSFHSRFLERFPRDPEASRVRQSLLDLTMGRELYGEALALLESEAQDLRRRGQDAAAVQAESRMMTLEEKHGSLERAVSRAEKLVTTDGATDESKAAAYGLLVRNATKQGDFYKVKEILQNIEPFADSQQKRETKAEALLVMANYESRGAIKEYFNLELTNPLSTLNHRYEAFADLKANYLKVCALGPTASCVPSQHGLARLSEKFGASLEEIDIQSTLAKPYVAQFRKEKQKIMNAIATTTMVADQNSLKQIPGGFGNGENFGDTQDFEAGMVDAQWVESVHWQNDGMWTTGKGQAVGSGFLQWPVNRPGVTP